MHVTAVPSNCQHAAKHVACTLAPTWLLRHLRHLVVWGGVEAPRGALHWRPAAAFPNAFVLAHANVTCLECEGRTTEQEGPCQHTCQHGLPKRIE